MKLMTMAFAAKAVATGVLLPLYIYPSVQYDDNAANWDPVFDAISDPSAQGFPWIVVVDPWSGPGSQQINTPTPGYDINYRSGVSQLNKLGLSHPVTTVGYVHLWSDIPLGNTSAQPEQLVKNNITIWGEWNSYTGANISVQGIFFDEATTDNYTYLSDLTSFARSTLGQGITIVCNPGAVPNIPNEGIYELCDVVICVENTWSAYDGQATLNAQGPQTNQAYISKAGVLVHTFVGTGGDGNMASVDTLRSELHTIKANGTGWTYFTTSIDYGNVTYPPPGIVTFAETFASA
jgi:hypothetical protein